MTPITPPEPDDLNRNLPTTAAPVEVDPSQGAGDGEAAEADDSSDAIDSPAKVLRIGGMAKELLAEVRGASLDEAGRARLRDIYEITIEELSRTLSGELRDELSRLTLNFSDGTPTEGELRVAQAQLVGWLEGLFHGIQAALFSQQIAVRAQMEQARQSLPPAPPDASLRPGIYL